LAVAATSLISLFLIFISKKLAFPHVKIIEFVLFRFFFFFFFCQNEHI
jgi:hypothetical protein